MPAQGTVRSHEQQPPSFLTMKRKQPGPPDSPLSNYDPNHQQQPYQQHHQHQYPHPHLQQQQHPPHLHPNPPHPNQLHHHHGHQNSPLTGLLAELHPPSQSTSSPPLRSPLSAPVCSQPLLLPRPHPSHDHRQRPVFSATLPQPSPAETRSPIDQHLTLTPASSSADHHHHGQRSSDRPEHHEPELDQEHEQASKKSRSSAKTTNGTQARTPRACLACRKQKMRCQIDSTPPCKRCTTLQIECFFERRTDYILNPQDLAWQTQIEDRVNQLSRSVEKIQELLALRDTHSIMSQNHPNNDEQSHLFNRRLSSNSHQHNRSTSPFRYILHSTASGSNNSGTSKPFEDPSHHQSTWITRQHELDLPPIRSHPLKTHSSSPLGKDIVTGSLSDLLPAVNHQDEDQTPGHYSSTSSKLDSVIDEEQAQEIFSHVQKRYNRHLPIFEFIPKTLDPDKIETFRNWSKNLNPFTVDVILCHGSINHPSKRSSKLFKPLLQQAIKNFETLIGPLSTMPLFGDGMDSIYQTDVTKKSGYELVLMICIATVYLSGPSLPYRFLSPSRIVSLLRSHSLRSAYEDLFEKEKVIEDHEVTPLARYQLYIWLYMIFCQFTQHGIILPDDIANSKSILNIRKLLELEPSGNSRSNLRRLLCAHAELLGIQQWSRKRWVIEFVGEPEWARETEIEDNLLGGMRNWWIRFEETRSKLEEWEQTWGSAIGSLADRDEVSKQNAPNAHLAAMIRMHFDAKRAANFASALFRLPVDVPSWKESESLYQLAITGVRLSSELLQNFISERPSGRVRMFPISSPKRSTERNPPGEPDMLSDLATCPVSIQRYPIPFAGVLLKAIQLKSCLSLRGVKEELFEDLNIEESLRLLDRVKKQCDSSGLNHEHPVSPVAHELEKMIEMTKKYIPNRI